MTDKTAEINIWRIHTGEDFRRKFLVEDPTLPKIPNPNFDPECEEDPIKNPKELFQPKDLTGFTARMDIRVGDGASFELVIRLETGGNGITLGSPDPADGTVELFIDNAVTEAAPIIDNKGKTLFFDFFLIPPGPADDNKRLFKGTIPVIESVTSFV